MVFDLDEFKIWARIDGSDLNAAATLALTAAEEYVAATTGLTLTEDMDLAKVACFGLATHWMEHPEPVVVGTIVAEVPMGVRRILAQLAEEI